MELSTKKIRKIIYFGILVLVIFIYVGIKEQERKTFDNIVKSGCGGIIESIDEEGKMVFFVVNGKQITFGEIGASIEDAAQIGDSLIKHQDSTYVTLIKRKIGNEKTSLRRFEIL